MKKEVFSYLVFGVLTTLINILSYALFTDLLGFHYTIATVLAWVLAVLFAFITNKLYVFESKSFQMKLFLKEFIFFIFFRALSLGLDLLSMVILIEWLKANDLAAKVVANVLVVLFNYAASKLFIFRKPKPGDQR